MHGLGAVSPAGWGVGPLAEALACRRPLPVEPLARPGRASPLRVRRVPVCTPRPAFCQHPRLRRASAISHFAMAVAIEALGPDAARVACGEVRLGIVFCAFTGSVSYSRRFYEEQLLDPATASPLLFTETVFNAPASHIAAYLGAGEVNYTVVGDQGEFVKSLALAADWLLAGRVDGCLVVAAEESDWLTADALRILSPSLPPAEGAGAVYLRREPAGVELRAVTAPRLFLKARSRAEAARSLAASLGVAESPADLLCDGLSGGPGDAAEAGAWSAWGGWRLSPKRTLGEGLAAASAWQCVAAATAILRAESTRSLIGVVGANEQAVGAVFAAPD